MGNDDFNMPFEDVVTSCYRVFHLCLGADRDVADANPGDRERWIHTIREALGWMPSYAGRSVSDAVDRIIEDYSQGEPIQAQAPYRREWEAVVRHLNTLLDCDEIDSLDSLETSWLAWSQHQQRQLLQENA